MTAHGTVPPQFHSLLSYDESTWHGHTLACMLAGAFFALDMVNRC